MLREQRYIFLFCLLTALIPFLAIDVPRSIAYVASIISVLFYAAYFYAYGKKPYFSKKTLCLCLIIFGISASSLIWAKFFETSFDQVVKLSYLLPCQVAMISLAFSLKAEDLKPYLHFFPIALCLASFLLCFEILTDGFIFKLIRNEGPEVYFNPAELNRGCVVMVLYFFSALAILKTRIKPLYATAILTAPILWMLLITDSQSSLLSFVAGLVFLCLFPYRSKISWLGLKLIILGFMASSPFLAAMVYQNLAATVEGVPLLARGYAGHRLEIWDYISLYILDNPWLGYGIEVTRDVTDFQTKGVYNPVNTVLHPHNFIFQIWIEFGVLGIVIAMGLMWKLLSILETNFNTSQQKILLPTLAAVLVPASTAYGMWQGWWLVLLFHVAAMSLLAVKFYGKGNNNG